MMMYFDFHTYFRMLRLAREEENPAGRRRLFFILLVVVPVVSTFHAICFFLDNIFFPGLRKVEVRTPVFIVGHARSGTTLMHRLMSKDGERFSFFLLYELFLPSLLQKKLIRFLATCDRRFLGARIEKSMQAWEERKFAATQDMHATGLTAPEEDDFIYTFSCASGFWIVLLPYMGLLDFYYVDGRPPQSRRRLMNFYKECVKRQLYLNGANKIHLSKNPTFSGRVESLIEAFPDARIVVLMRNPYETVPSLLKLMQRSWQLRGWDDAQMNRSLRALADQSFHTYKYPLEVLARHPNTKQAIVDYRDLVAQPKRTVEAVYAQLGFPMSSEFSQVLTAEEQRAKSHETTHTYSLEEFGLKSDEIHAALADLFERYGWDAGAPHPATNEGAR
ncbi:MAG: sulfotransferase family protein [Candidatus Binatia bacterium]